MKKDLAPSTISQYEYFLSKYPDLDIKDADKTYNELINTKQARGKTNKPISLSCIKIVISAILWKLRQETDVDNWDIMKKYKNYINAMCEITEKKELDHKLNAKDIPLWEDIIKIRHQLLVDKKLKVHLLLSLYTYIPPRRLKDYHLMKIVKSKDAIKELDFNYYIIGTNTLVFNNYKTKKSFSQQTVEIPNDLKAILMNYISCYKLPNGYRLFDYNTYHPLHFMLRSAIGTGIDNLRHSYINNMYKNFSIPENNLMEQTALAMGHSLQTHLRYRKYNDTDKIKSVGDTTMIAPVVSSAPFPRQIRGNPANEPIKITRLPTQ